MRVKVESTVPIQDGGGAALAAAVSSKPTLKVCSHERRSELVVLEVDGKTFTVDAAELTRAVQIASATY